MPGVPHEMKHIMNERVLPELRKRFRSQTIIHKNIMTYGQPEAKLAEILTGFEEQLPREVKLAYLPASGIIKLRLTATGKEKKELEKIVEIQVKELYKTIPDLIFAEDEETLEMVIGKNLRDKKATMCSAESCTGGEIAHMITSVPGSSGWYAGSVIAYANEIKIRMLGVPENVLKKHGAVSSEVVKCMATGSRKLFGTQYSVATSGIAGPDGGSEEKPVGTVWIAVATENGVISEKYTFGNDRLINIRRFSLAALNMLRKQIISD
jgi:nicotinamide-nucleotide amidase